MSSTSSDNKSTKEPGVVREAFDHDFKVSLVRGATVTGVFCITVFGIAALIGKATSS